MERAIRIPTEKIDLMKIRTSFHAGIKKSSRNGWWKSHLLVVRTDSSFFLGKKYIFYSILKKYLNETTILKVYFLPKKQRGPWKNMEKDNTSREYIY